MRSALSFSLLASITDVLGYSDHAYCDNTFIVTLLAYSQTAYNKNDTLTVTKSRLQWQFFLVIFNSYWGYWDINMPWVMASTSTWAAMFVDGWPRAFRTRQRRGECSTIVKKFVPLCMGRTFSSNKIDMPFEMRRGQEHVGDVCLCVNKHRPRALGLRDRLRKGYQYLRNTLIMNWKWLKMCHCNQVLSL